MTESTLRGKKGRAVGREAGKGAGRQRAAARPRDAAAMPWREVVASYSRPSVARSTWQLVNTLVPYVALWCLMVPALKISFWLMLPLAVLAGGFLVRTFIIFHDCGHGSFFKSSRANTIVGVVTGLLTFVSYHQWRWEHSVHHGSAGDLDRRGMGDVWTLTVQEYLESSRWRKFAYRLARNPIILFVIAPLWLFVVRERLVTPGASAKARRGVHLTNLALLAIAVGMSLLIGIEAYLVIQLSTMLVAGSAGIWLFYVQHQFEGVYWERGEEWDYTKAALEGSSFYKLPKVLQFFSGNIGFHHLHHLSPRIPNYYLEKCHRAEPSFQRVPVLTLLKSLKSITFRLWDEQQRRLVAWSHLRQLRREARQRMIMVPGETPPTV